MMFLACWVTLFTNIILAETLPIVVWHGINSDCCTGNVGKAVDELRSEYGVYVRSIQIGDSVHEDFMRSFFGNVNDQVDMVCKMLKEDEQLASGFNAIGISQGGQFFRAYVERCNDPPVHNLITFGSQHQGVSRFPGCVDGKEKSDWNLFGMVQENAASVMNGQGIPGMTCEQIDSILTNQVYKPVIQNSIIPAQYMKIPSLIDEYYRSNKFLTDINNELDQKNAQYKKNMRSLNKFVMYMFDNDEVVIPKESSHFGYFNGTKLLTLEEQAIYQEDWIGLKALDERGDLERLTLPGAHVQFDVGVIAASVRPYLSSKNPKWRASPDVNSGANAAGMLPVLMTVSLSSLILLIL